MPSPGTSSSAAAEKTQKQRIVPSGQQKLKIWSNHHQQLSDTMCIAPLLQIHEPTVVANLELHEKLHVG
jgi:hypothetical protein